MASESTDDDTAQVRVPGEVEDWLDDRAEALDMDRETVLARSLVSYKHAAELADGEGAEAMEDALEDLLVESIGDLVDQLVADAVEAATGDAAAADVADRMDALEADVDQKIQDVRERVIQVKREADAKAPAEHSHEALEQVEDLADQVSVLEGKLGTVEDRVDEVGEEVDAVADDAQAEVADVTEKLEDVEERLQTVAWVVSDLREAYESETGVEAVDRIKRAAAQADVTRARCENCGEGVEVGLLTEPRCPHCEATVTNVEAASGFFGKPQLLVASQLESGEEQ